jgi:predicted RNA-binding Zn-ribbon protein involved in translation (DUF1610 family)
MPRTCPKCGEFSLHRSHSQNVLEHLIKTFLPLRPYRCGTCKWRGWKLKERSFNKSRFVRNLILYTVVLIIALLFAAYIKTMFQ